MVDEQAQVGEVPGYGLDLDLKSFDTTPTQMWGSRFTQKRLTLGKISIAILLSRVANRLGHVTSV